MKKKIEFAQMKTFPRYRLEWKAIPQSNEVKYCPLQHEDLTSYAEAMTKFSMLRFEAMYATLIDRMLGDRWEFMSGWLDHYPRSKWEEDEDDLHGQG